MHIKNDFYDETELIPQTHKTSPYQKKISNIS